jgi:hypothetical protein
LEALERSLNETNMKLENLHEQVAGFKMVDDNFELVSKEFRLVQSQLDHLNKKVDILRGDTNVGFEDVGIKLGNIYGEISKIGKVTNYSDYSNNLNSIN